MKIVLAQIEILPGRVEKNLEKIIACVRDHADAGLIVFPELALTGIFSDDSFIGTEMLEKAVRADKEIRTITENFDGAVLYGNVFQKTPDSGFRNAMTLVCRGQTPFQFVKHRLSPEERRYFVPPDHLESPCFTLTDREGNKYRFALCWGLGESDDAVAAAKAGNVRYLLDISTEPYRSVLRARRENILRDRLDTLRASGKTTGLEAYLRTNCVGVQMLDKSLFAFAGESEVRNGRGDLLANDIAPFEEGVIIFDTENPVPALRHDEFQIEEERSSYQFEAIVRALRYMDRLRGRSDFPWILGLSGGIDSAVVRMLLEYAVGPGRIRAFNLPSRFNSPTTRSIAGRIDPDVCEIPIDALADAVARLLCAIGVTPGDFHYENIQAKVRGTDILSNIAGILGGLLTCNGNKVEAALGYTTLYGDTNGAIAPLADLTKLEVWHLASRINGVFEDEVIPRELFPENPGQLPHVLPSAELNVDQIDPMKWGYHDALTVYLNGSGDRTKCRDSIDILKKAWKTGELATLLTDPVSFDLLTESEMRSILKRYRLDEEEVFLEDLDWFLRLFRNAVFKRAQLPPVVVLSHSALGHDYHETQLPAQ